MSLEDEWKKLLDHNRMIYIYGAGKIGRKILSLIMKEEYRQNVKGFLVTDLAQNSAEIEGIPVKLPEDVFDKTSLILVSVTEIYQDAIVGKLNGMGFSNVQVAYKFSFLLDEETEDLPKTTEIDTSELLLCQFKKSQFCRYDIIVGLLAVENYYGRNNHGLDLYKKMRKSIDGGNSAEMAARDFGVFIRSLEGNEKQKELELNVDRKLQLADDLRKLALAMFFSIDRFKIKILPIIEDTYFGKEMLCQVYTESEIQQIEQRLLDEESKRQHLIKGILWPCVAKYYDEIIEKIQEKYVVTNIHDYVFELQEFEQIVHKIYEVGNIAEWKIETKLKYMKPYFPYCIRTFDVDMGNPEFRIRKAGGILSDKGAILKKQIRELYRDRIPEYFSDIIIHTADDLYQSRYLDSLFRK